MSTRTGISIEDKVTVFGTLAESPVERRTDDGERVVDLTIICFDFRAKSEAKTTDLVVTYHPDGVDDRSARALEVGMTVLAQGGATPVDGCGADVVTIDAHTVQADKRCVPMQDGARVRRAQFSYRAAALVAHPDRPGCALVVSMDGSAEQRGAAS